METRSWRPRPRLRQSHLEDGRAAAPECLPNRWYTDDVAIFYYYRLWGICLLGYIIPETAKHDWVHGIGSGIAGLDEMDGADHAKTKTERTVAFVRPIEFGAESLK